MSQENKVKVRFVHKYGQFLVMSPFTDTGNKGSKGLRSNGIEDDGYAIRARRKTVGKCIEWCNDKIGIDNWIES